MLKLDLRVNDCLILLGCKVDFDKLKAADFRRGGIIGRVTGVAKKRHFVYKTGNCQIACFHEAFSMTPLNLLPSTQCDTVAELYLGGNLPQKVMFTVRSRKIPRFNVPTSAEIYLDEFLKACHKNIGPPIHVIEDWGYVWEDDDSILKAGILSNKKQFFVIWEIKKVK